MKAALPKIKAETILANVAQAKRSGNPGRFVLEWVEKFSSKGQEELCSSTVELIDAFYGDEDGLGKVHCATVVGILLNSILASIEAKELEKMFEETT